MDRKISKEHLQSSNDITETYKIKNKKERKNETKKEENIETKGDISIL